MQTRSHAVLMLLGTALLLGGCPTDTQNVLDSADAARNTPASPNAGPLTPGDYQTVNGLSLSIVMYRDNRLVDRSEQYQGKAYYLTVADNGLPIQDGFAEPARIGLQASGGGAAKIQDVQVSGDTVTVVSGGSGPVRGHTGSVKWTTTYKQVDADLIECDDLLIVETTQDGSPVRMETRMFGTYYRLGAE